MRHTKTLLFRLLLILTGVFSVVTAWAGGSSDSCWSAYRERIEMKPDGSALVKIQARLEGARPANLVIPVTVGKYGSGRLLSPQSLELPGEILGGTTVVRVDLRAYPDELKDVTLEYVATGVFDPQQSRKTDYGNVVGTYKYMQLQPCMISSYTAELLLPEGMQLKAVDEFLPKVKKDDPHDPYAVRQTNDGRQMIVIEVNHLAFGQQIVLKWRQYRKDGQYGLFVGVLLLAVLYLVFFRDLISTTQETQKE
ncbi:MAG TPA: hypothetical protein PKO06_22685 [Candidatus Ozemobacteraceae bacterium]|nr:hypothetical protein [Candidatus Ozemobacteraceae bacterium]